MIHIRYIYKSYYRNIMGIVKISDELHQQVRQSSTAMTRSINAQAEFWIKVGMMAELNPNLSYNDLARKLLLAESTALKELIHD